MRCTIQVLKEPTMINTVQNQAPHELIICLS